MQCLKNPDPVSLKLLIEGPYGQYFPTRSYDTIVLVAGGTGIAGVLPYIRTPEKGTKTTRIRLIWATRQSSMTIEVAKRELTKKLRSQGFEGSFYVTGEDEKQMGRPNDLRLRIERGRPDMMTLVSEEVRESGQRRTAVICCGPARMADDVRACVHGFLLEGFKELEYVEETFGW